MKTLYQFKSYDEYKAYLEGYYEGVENYAIWKDGKQLVGCMQKPLSEIRAEISEKIESLNDELSKQYAISNGLSRRPSESN